MPMRLVTCFAKSLLADRAEGFKLICLSFPAPPLSPVCVWGAPVHSPAFKIKLLLMHLCRKARLWIWCGCCSGSEPLSCPCPLLLWSQSPSVLCQAELYLHFFLLVAQVIALNGSSWEEIRSLFKWMIFWCPSNDLVNYYTETRTLLMKWMKWDVTCFVK